MRYENVIWDFDGTLFDTYPPMCRDLQAAMAELGLDFPLAELLDRFTQSRGSVLEYCAAGAGRTAQEADRIYRDYVERHGQPEALPFPQAEALLARFQAAGGRNFIFTHRSGSVHDYLRKAGLTGYFTDVVSAGTTFARKPDPAGNRYLLRTHGLDPDRTLAVGDRELDVLAAKGAGISACLVSPEGAETAADYRMASLEGLWAILELERN